MAKTKAMGGFALLFAIIFISFNLRAPITSIGSLAGLIHDELQVTNGFIGFITTLPLLAFSICSPFVFKISDKFGMGVTMAFSIIATILGGTIRSFTGITGLVAGTALIGVGIAIGNVLIPSIIKLKFPNKIGMLTSLYITFQGLFAAIGAGISYPLAVNYQLGWKFSLFVWVIVAILALFMWIPQIGIKIDPSNNFSKEPHKNELDSAGGVNLSISTKLNSLPLLKSPLAWAITIFMGAQSLCFYSITAWLPSILITKGLTAEASGYMAFWYQLVGLPASFFIPIIATKINSKQVAIVAVSCTSYFVGIIALAISQSGFSIMIAMILTSTGGGATFAWVVLMIGLKSKHAQQVAQLSGMSQSFGYLLAAVGPTLAGVFYDISGTWTLTIGFLLIIVAVMLTAGLKVTRMEVL